MRRYIYNIKYNEGDKTMDRIYIDAFTKELAMKKLKKQFPGVYIIEFVRIEKEL